VTTILVLRVIPEESKTTAYKATVSEAYATLGEGDVVDVDFYRFLVTEKLVNIRNNSLHIIAELRDDQMIATFNDAVLTELGFVQVD